MLFFEYTTCDFVVLKTGDDKSITALMQWISGMQLKKVVFEGC